MIACVAPNMNSTNHTINTLRYSDRLKEKSNKQVYFNLRGNYNNNNKGERYDKNNRGYDDIQNKILSDDNINHIDFDDNFNLNDDKFLIENSNDSGAHWEYLKKTVHSKDGKMLSDEFIRYHQVNDRLVEIEDEIVNLHMKIIKEDAKLLTEEGDLITNIKGVGEKVNFEMEAYADRLDEIIDKKIAIYNELKDKIDEYK